MVKWCLALVSSLNDLHLELMNLRTKCHFQKWSTVNECYRAGLHFSGEPLLIPHVFCFFIKPLKNNIPAQTTPCHNFILHLSFNIPPWVWVHQTERSCRSRPSCVWEREFVRRCTWTPCGLRQSLTWLCNVTMQQNNGRNRSPVTATWTCSCKALDRV